MTRCWAGSLPVCSLRHVIPSPSTSLATRHWISRSGQPSIQFCHSQNINLRQTRTRRSLTTSSIALQEPNHKVVFGQDAKPRRKAWTPAGNDFIEEGASRGSSSSRSAKPSRYGREDWQTQKSSLRGKFKEGWNPKKKLSPDAQDGIRALNAQQPDVYTTSVLAQEFQVSPEAIRRILKSKWRPSEAETVDRHRRWENRGLGIWAAKTAMGQKPPQRWREMMNEKVEENGRDAAIGLIKGPIAQAMLARDIEEKNKARQERLKMSTQTGAKTVHTPAESISNTPSSGPVLAAAPKRRGRPRLNLRIEATKEKTPSKITGPSANPASDTPESTKAEPLIYEDRSIFSSQ